MSKRLDEPISDECLLQLARSGNPTAIVEFARRYWPIVLRIAWSMLGDTAHAITATEEVFGVALHSPAPPGIPIGLWMYRFAIWLAIVRRRSGARAARPGTPLFEALGGLDNQDRAAFVLRDVERLAASDVAAILESSPAEIGKRVHRARIHLTRALGDSASAANLEIDPALRPAPRPARSRG